MKHLNSQNRGSLPPNEDAGVEAKPSVLLEGKGRLEIVIFTDLDATLLDHDSYSYEAALPALDLIKSRSIPLVICTSKTRAEVEHHRVELGNHDPFICENGGAVFLPKGYFAEPPSGWQEVGLYHLVEFGEGYRSLVEKLSAMKSALGFDLKGFSDLSAEDIALDCGMSLEMAKLAKHREYDEPVLIGGLSEKEVERIVSTAESFGLKVVLGTRYMHLTGGNDKGLAVAVLLDLFRLDRGPVASVALGDSPNDLPMLAKVDYPFLVQKRDGSYSKGVIDSMPWVNLADGIGPRGLNNALLALLSEL